MTGEVREWRRGQGNDGRILVWIPELCDGHVRRKQYQDHRTGRLGGEIGPVGKAKDTADRELPGSADDAAFPGIISGLWLRR